MHHIVFLLFLPWPLSCIRGVSSHIYTGIYVPVWLHWHSIDTHIIQATVKRREPGNTVLTSSPSPLFSVSISFPLIISGLDAGWGGCAVPPRVLVGFISWTIRAAERPTSTCKTNDVDPRKCCYSCKSDESKKMTTNASKVKICIQFVLNSQRHTTS